MTSKIKTLFFATLIAVMILPLSGMQMAEAKEVPNDIMYKQVSPVISEYRQSIIDQVAEIGEALSESTSEHTKIKLQNQLESLKPDMLANGLTPSFDFDEDLEVWEKKLRPATASSGYAVASASSDWHIKHQLK